MIEYKNDEAFNFEVIGQDTITKESAAKEIELFINSSEEDLKHNVDFNIFDQVENIIMRKTLSEFKTVFEQVKNN